MRKLTLLLLLAGCAPTVAAKAIDETRDADPNGRISVSNLAGSVEISGWDRNQVQVTGELGDDVEELVFEREGSQIIIKVKAPDRSWGKKDVTSDLVIRVPKNSSINVATVSADIDVENVLGEQDLQAVSGDIDVQVFGAEVRAETVSGDVAMEGDGSDGEWVLSSVSGDVRASDLAGQVRAEVVSGDIEIGGGAFGRVNLETVNGDIEFRSTLRPGGRFDAESVNGSVDVFFVGSVTGRFEIKTFNGRIRNCFGPKPERTSRYAPGLELMFTEGSDGGRISIATLNGSLTLCKD
ncbi:MAG: DUF4097 family beta strand repeat-containing protein [Woeseiaceae bacterium]|nr:DUF4097 family beta strand repeat-containing protein [Woeseiaceae bacterium]